MTESPRADLVERLLHRPDRRDLAQIRALTRAEIETNKQDDDIGCGDTLYGLCFLLYLVGDAEDVALIHEAKSLNIDTGFMIDRDLLMMRRDQATMLRAVATLDGGSPRLARDVAAAFEQPTYSTPGELAASLRAYFGVDG